MDKSDAWILQRFIEGNCSAAENVMLGLCGILLVLAIVKFFK